MATDWTLIGSGMIQLARAHHAMMAFSGDNDDYYESNAGGKPSIYMPLSLRQKWTALLESGAENQAAIKSFLDYADSMTSQATNLARAVDTPLKSFVSEVVRSEIESGENAGATNAILLDMDAGMYVSGMAVLENTVSLTLPTAGASNFGDGVLYGENQIADFSADDALIDGETAVDCDIDAACTGAATAGAETFRLRMRATRPGFTSPGDVNLTVVKDTTGTAQTTGKTGNIITDSSFEGMLASGSGGWSFGSGFRYASGASWAGEISLFASGAGITASAALLLGNSLTVESLGESGAYLAGSGNIEKNTLYFFEARAHTPGALSGTVTMSLESATSGNQTLATWTDDEATADYVTKSGVFRTSPDQAADTCLFLRDNGISGTGVHFDGIRVWKPTRHGTILWGITRGEADFEVGDLFEAGSVANDEAGMIQTMRRNLRYNGQFPSDSSASAEFDETDD